MSQTVLRFVLFATCVLATAATDSQPNGHENDDCPENLVFQNCGSACPRTCDMITGGSCRRLCVAQCGCGLDLPILHNGRCIRASECPPKEEAKNKTIHEVLCPFPQVWQQCGAACNRTCENDQPACQRICMTRCACPDDRPYWHKDKCISTDDCPKKPEKPDKPDGSRTLPIVPPSPPTPTSKESEKVVAEEKLRDKGVANILKALGLG